MTKTSNKDTLGKTSKIDAASVYGNPQAVLSDADLSREEKIEILKHWEYDAREIQVATEENMAGTEEEPVLDQISKALESLSADSGTETTTKQGG